MTFKLLHNLGQVKKTFDAMELDVKRASRQTVTQLTFKVRGELKKETQTKLKDPVPWITSAWFATPARDLDNPVGIVSVKVPAKRPFIDSIVNTGAHIPTNATKRARSSGLLASNESLVPTRRLKRNKKGNIGRSGYKRLSKLTRVAEGDERGFYGKGTSGKYTKLFTPSTVSRYQKRIDLLQVANRVTPGYATLFEKNLQANLEKTASKFIKRL